MRTRADCDEEVESKDLENRLIACSCNSDYSVRGICAVFDFRGGLEQHRTPAALAEECVEPLRGFRTDAAF